MSNVLIKNQNTDLCSGCGVCSASCPSGFLQIRENDYGELRPFSCDDSRCTECGLCMTVCPFKDGIFKSENKTGSCYIGWADEHRDNSSSGGCCTWFMNKLLEKNIVDAVITVKAAKDGDNLFQYTVCRNLLELKECAGSAYYPVSLEEILKEIIKSEERVAVIGVPCFVSAVQNLRKKSKKWSDKIAVVIGLVCGNMPSKRMTDVLLWANGKERKDIENCRFRFRDAERPAWDYGVKFEFKDGTEFKSYGSEEFGFLFWRRFFSQKSCNYCSDVFAEQADITFMDAWLPEYKDEKKGTSLIINRKKEFEEILSELNSEGYIQCADISTAKTAQEKLVKYKSEAGNHKSEERLRVLTQKICEKNSDNKSIINDIHRLAYKEKLKKDNVLLWTLMELKDRMKKR